MGLEQLHLINRSVIRASWAGWGGRKEGGREGRKERRKGGREGRKEGGQKEGRRGRKGGRKPGRTHAIGSYHRPGTVPRALHVSSP